uniref:Carboxylesterase type B domain-containing protein n=1 Tax=Plectus sambesii TaxID=2011161 RepID=A0A914VJ12_9BILA
MLRAIGVLLFLGFAGVRSAAPIERTISNGIIAGQLLTTKANNSAFAFLGIPFAQAPVGDLRFRKPVEPHPWTGVLNCTVEKAACIGDDTKDSQSEDCLYLDILQPKQCEEDPTLCAIFAYFHSDLTTDLPTFVDNLVRDGVIVVIIPHRQGPLGFLNLASDNDYDKNAGIYDLLLALKFVSDEIDIFGGDKSQLTIGGHGVGGELVGYLSLSPMANGLFSRAVALSGAPDMHQKLSSDANRDLTQQLVQRKKCQSDTISCLRKLNAEALLINDYFGPAIDEHIFVADVHQLRNTRSPKPYLIGVSSKNASRPLSTEESCRTAAASLGLASDVVIEKCKEHYDNRGQEAIFDATTVVPIVNEAASMAQSSNQTYLYSVEDFSDPYETYDNASRIFTELLKNFIKYGQPGEQWRPLDVAELNYLQLSASKATIRNAPLFHWDAVGFWNRTAPSLQQGYDFQQSERGDFDYETAFWVAVCVAVVLFMVICVRTVLNCCASRRQKLFSKYAAIDSDDSVHQEER